MTLFSIHFVIFIIVTTLVYYTVAGKYQWVCLLAASMYFYLVSGGVKALLFLVATGVTTFLSARRIDAIGEQYKADSRQEGLTREDKKAMRAESAKRQHRWLIATLLLNFGILAVLKYGGFAVENVNHVLSGVGAQEMAVPNLLLPLGISFYTFQSMGYLIDVNRGKYRADQNFLKFFLFVSYFPQMIQGPIGRYDKLAGQLTAEHKWDDLRFREGFLRVLWGFFKKIVLAEGIGIMVAQVFDNYREYAGFVIFMGVFYYGIQIYADFSGGMDIVIGVSQILDVTMSENFRQPFFARSDSEFWQRWHITLGQWMKDYVFYSITFSGWFAKLQKKTRKKFGRYYGKILPTCIASFIVFMIVGIWHGASWKYIIYGFYHAVFVFSDTLFERVFEKQRKFLHINVEAFAWKVFQILRTILIVTFGRYLSRADSARHAFAMYRQTFSSFNPWTLVDGTLYRLGVSERNCHMLFLAVLLVFVVDVFNERGIVVRKVIARQDVVTRWVVYIAAIAAVLILGTYGEGFNASAFIYQNF